MELLAAIIQSLFGCWHRHLSFPMTLRKDRARPAAARATGTYVVCLDCGKEFAYDWKNLQILSEKQSTAAGARRGLAPWLR